MDCRMTWKHTFKYGQREEANRVNYQTTELVNSQKDEFISNP